MTGRHHISNLLNVGVALDTIITVIHRILYTLLKVWGDQLWILVPAFLVAFFNSRSFAWSHASRSWCRRVPFLPMDGCDHDHWSRISTPWFLHPINFIITANLNTIISIVLALSHLSIPSSSSLQLCGHHYFSFCWVPGNACSLAPPFTNFVAWWSHLVVYPDTGWVSNPNLLCLVPVGIGAGAVQPSLPR